MSAAAIILAVFLFPRRIVKDWGVQREGSLPAAGFYY